MAGIQETKIVLKKDRKDRKNRKDRKDKLRPIYHRSMLTQTIEVPFINIGKNIKQTLEKIITSNNEGKCISEGFIKPDSIKLFTYSSGEIQAEFVKYTVVFECDVCLPVEGMLIKCVAKNITKAGIRAEIDDDISPVVIFIARDHHYENAYFSSIEVGNEIIAKVIGQRYELNDMYISVIAEIMEPKKTERKKKAPYLILK